VVDNYRNAMFVWPRTRWLKRGGGPVLNANLWRDLVRNMRRIGKRVDFVKVKAHSKDIHNRAVDKLAKQSAMNPLNRPLTVTTVRRRKSKETTQIGSVALLGQRIRIRIIDGRYLGVQHVYRYRYEVMSKKSPYFGKVDFVCAAAVLREGHTYSIRLNAQKENPRIAKVFREILPKDKSH
jgi:hypothetical protein